MTCFIIVNINNKESIIYVSHLRAMRDNYECTSKNDLPSVLDRP